MNIEAILWDWQSDEDPLDVPCPECCGAGVVCIECGGGDMPDYIEIPCPLCEGTGEYDEAFMSLLDALDAGAAHVESMDVA